MNTFRESSGVVVRVSLLLIACLLTAACESPKESIEIQFEVRYGDTRLSCDASPAVASLSDLRFYVHNIRLLDASGNELKVALNPDNIWQSETVAMLDFENGEGDCVNGSPQTNLSIRGQYVGHPASGLRMNIGVPEDYNHADPMLASAPLTYTPMHWHWKSGYKFMRAGIRTPGNDGFWIHLGSSRCEGTIGNIIGCKSANRPVIDLPEFVAGESVVIVDLQRLTHGLDLNNREVSECQSGPAESECESPFKALGVEFSSGTTIAPALIFHTKAR